MASVVCVRGLHRLAAVGEALGSAPAERRGAVRWIGPLAWSVLLCTSIPVGAARSQDAPSTLVVTVSNGTADGASVADDAVIVQLFRQQQLQNALESRADEAGKAVFMDIPIGPQLTAVARVKHQNMTFQSTPVSLVPGTDDLSIAVKVFDVSEDTSALSVGTHHIMLALLDTALEVTEYMQLKNDSDMAIRGSERDAQDRSIVVQVILPKGATDLKPLSFFQSSALVMTETGFYDTLAVPPGEHQVRFSYRIDVDQQAVAVVKGISLPTSELVVFWEKGQGELAGLGEPDEQLTNEQDMPVEYYRRLNLQPGDKVTFQVSGFNVKSSDTDTWIALAVAFGIVVVLAIWRLRSGASPPPPID